MFLCEEILLRGSFLGGALGEHFFPLNNRNVIIGNYSSPPYPKARSRMCCHSLSHAFRYGCLASLRKNKKMVVMYAQFLLYQSGRSNSIQVVGWSLMVLLSF